MTWLRALGLIVRSGLTIERTRLEPLVALRAAAGVATVIGLALWLVSPAYATSAAFGAFSAGTATFQRSWRPRKVLALAAGAGLALSTFLGYLAGAHPVPFLLLLAVWAFGAGMAWAAGSTAGIVAATTIGIMLVTTTLPTTVVQALEHAAVIAFGGVVQATLILLFPIRRWGAHRDALAYALAAAPELNTGRRVIGDPKSRAGKREIVLPAFMHKEVRRHLEWFAQPGKAGLVFVGERGAVLRGTTFGRKWRKARDQVGLPDNFRFYDLRHTGNTLAADTGAKLKDLMVRAGQSSERAQLIYQHSTKKHQRKLAADIDADVLRQQAEATADIDEGATIHPLVPRACDAGTLSTREM